MSSRQHWLSFMTMKVLHYLTITASQTFLKLVFLFENLLLNLQINWDLHVKNNVDSFSACLFNSTFDCSRAGKCSGGGKLSKLEQVWKDFFFRFIKITYHLISIFL